jgi:GNAT superfamily N-acetyltransferase
MVTIRDPLPTDERAWRHLWDNYNAFYNTSISEIVTAHTWRRILTPTSPVFARLAIDDEEVVGFSISVLHEGTWTLAPICYLEDMFVDRMRRRRGVGRLLLNDLVSIAQHRGWSRLYWHTRGNNPARNLYDLFVQADDFVRYRMILSHE